MKLIVLLFALTTLATASLIGGKTIKLQDDGSLIIRNDIGKQVVIPTAMGWNKVLLGNSFLDKRLGIRKTIPDMVPRWMCKDSTCLDQMTLRRSPIMMDTRLHKTPDMRGSNRITEMVRLPWWKCKDLTCLIFHDRMTPKVYMRDITSRMDVRDLTPRMDMEDMRTMMDVRDLTPKMDMEDMTKMRDVRHLTPRMDMEDMTTMMDVRHLTPRMDMEDMTTMMDLRDLTPRMDMEDMTTMMDVRDMTPRMDMEDMTTMMDVRDMKPRFGFQDMIPSDMHTIGRFMRTDQDFPLEDTMMLGGDKTTRNILWSMHLNKMNTLARQINERRRMDDERRRMDDDLVFLN